MHRIQTTVHKSTRHFIMTGIGTCIALIGLYLSVYSASANTPVPLRNVNLSGLQTPQNLSMQQALQAFKGQWYIHSGVLTIQDNGQATFIARAYQNCATDNKKPCDTWQGNTIFPGIHEDITITHVADNTAYGVINKSTDNRNGQPVMVELQPQNTVLFDNHILCGPKAPVGYCGA